MISISPVTTPPDHPSGVAILEQAAVIKTNINAKATNFALLSARALTLLIAELSSQTKNHLDHRKFPA
jgi:hypothetical protein